MDVLGAFVRTIVKMFAADLWLSLSAVGVVAASGAALSLHLLSPAGVPYLLPVGVMAALVIGVARGSRRKP